MRKRAKYIKPALFLLLLGSCGLQLVRAATSVPVTTPITKDVVKSGREAVSRVGGEDVRAPLADQPGLVGGNGIVEPAERETRVAAQVTAVVQKVLVREGATVKAGDVLVELANATERAQVAAAEADVAQERAHLQRTNNGMRAEEQDALEADRDAARARAARSADTLVRTERLQSLGAISAEELERDRRQAQADAALARATQARVEAAKAGSRTEEITAAKARLSAAQARLDQARANLARLTVRAPLDGEILQVKIREGELYSFQGGVEPLVIMGDTRKLRVRMDVDERDIARVALGAAAYVVADAFGARKFTGQVVEVGRRFGRKNVRTDDPVERNDTKILEVVIQLDENVLLVPGQRVTSFIAASEVEPVRTNRE